MGAEWTVSGEFEMRVSRADAATLHVAFYRRRGRSLSVSAKASAGLTATIRGRDMLATLMRAISSDPETDLLTLVNAGLDDESILAIEDAIKASIDRSLTVSAQLQVSALRENEAVFAYEVDLNRLDDAGKAALGEALHGRLAKIGEAPADGAIRMVSSAARQLRERKTSWKINLLGIVNVASFVELVREGTVLYDPVSGALTAADKVSARRIRVKEMPLASDAEKLRKLLFESLMITAAYRASPRARHRADPHRQPDVSGAARPHQAAGTSRTTIERSSRSGSATSASGTRGSRRRPSSVPRRSSSRTVSMPPPVMRCSWTPTASRTRSSITRPSAAARCWR